MWRPSTVAFDRFTDLSVQPINNNHVNNQIIELQLKGDGSLFQFRIKAAKYDRHSYVYDFKTTGQWETILIPLKDMFPSFRGYTLNIPNFDQSSIERIGFLKASKKNSAFQLEIKSISLSATL